jgi:betaine-aldehyde dehydrogenase
MSTTVSGVETPAVLVRGALRGAHSGATMDSVNPATGAIVARVPRCDGEDVADAVAAALEAFPGWRATPAQERAERVLALARHIADHGEELARLDVIDNGSPIREMRKDVGIATSWMRHFAGLALHVRGETIPTGHERVNYTLREPFGVVGRIIPFNHPLMFAASKIAAPLITGNTVVLKPSEHTSLSALALGEAMREIFPAGVVNVVTGTGAEAGDALVAHPDVRRLAFIGHPDTGRTIQARAAGVAVKTVTLELGGKNPLVVFPDADVDDAVEGALRGMNFTWQGQSCGSTSRLIVHQSIHDSFVERLAERMGELRSGDPPRGGRAARRRRGATRGGRVRRRPVHPAHAVHRSAARHAPRPRGDLRPGSRGDAILLVRGGRAHRQRRPVRPHGERLDARPAHRARVRP